MSALPPKADICSALGHVRYGPKAEIAQANKEPQQFSRAQSIRLEQCAKQLGCLLACIRGRVLEAVHQETHLGLLRRALCFERR